MRPRKAIAWLLVASPLLVAADAPVGASMPRLLTLEWCLAQANQSNAEIARERASVEAAEHRVLPAGSLDDPRFVYEASNLPSEELDFDSTMMSGHQLRLAQRFPFPGLLAARENAARAAVHVARQRLADRRLRVASEVERAWAELGFAQRALELTDGNVELLRRINRIAEAKYRVGSGLQQDVLRAQVELSVLLDQRLRREAAIERAAAKLAALLDLASVDPLPRTADLIESAPVPELETLLARLEATHPHLAALREEVAEAERMREAAVLEGYPDFDLGIGYRIRRSVPGDPVSGEDFVSAGVTVRLPVNRSKWNEKIAAQAAVVRRTEAAYRDERARLRASVRSALAELERAHREALLLETGLVPQARQSLESSRAGYQVNKVDFVSLIDSQVRLLESELRLLRARTDRRSAFAALEATFGESLR